MVSPRMPTRQKRADRVELMQGTLDMLVLRTLRPGATHGQAIAKAIERNSDDVLQVEQDALSGPAPASQARVDHLRGRRLREQPARQLPA